MIFRFRFQYYILLLLIAFPVVQTFSQCLDIETILVDSCDSSGDEGFNEMTRFRIAGAPVNVATMNVNWPAQSWQGLAQNGLTASKVATLNAQIAALGGCGRLIEPIAGVIPANTEVILITSQNFSLTANAFGALIQDIYILFQDNTTITTGHFGNYNATSGIRTLVISFGSCSDTVSYDRSLLVDANGLPGSSNGATVNFTAAGVATYTNGGCVAPIDVFSVEAGNSVAVCPGATITLAGAAQGQASVSWTAPSGTFSNNTALNSNYILPFSASGSVVLTLTVTNSCGNSITDTVTITVNPSTTPNFSPTLAFCSGTTAPTLNTTSPNGITGTWLPSIIDNTLSGNYTFTPNTGQCATNFVMAVTVNPSTVPDFSPTLTLCSGSAAPTLNTTSPNGIVGVWSPAVISNTLSDTYVFTANTGQCASNFALSVTVSAANIVPDFAPTLSLCTGSTAPTLNPTSPNGISGVWSPAVISNMISDTYFFTANAGQCANNFTLSVTVSNATIIPDFATTLALCSGNVAPTLNATSPNGITGVWSPLTISNTVGNTYTFNPNAGQCAAATALTVTITPPSIVPTFNPISPICVGGTLSPLPVTSTNGITGIWSPALDNTQTTTYNFTPNAGQCAVNTSLLITVNNPTIVPIFTNSSGITICVGDSVPFPTTSNNGITGTWSPAFDNTQTTTYTFMPNAGQCALTSQMMVSVIAMTTPTFNAVTPVCSGTILAPLPTTSLNGFTGSWSPALNNTQTTTYTFTPDGGQCATTTTLIVNIIQRTTPDFTTVLSICSGQNVPTLASVSPNGFSGTWSPLVIDNTISDTYTFTPNVGQCANPTALTVTVTPNPVLQQTSYICFDTAGQLVAPATIDTGLSAADHSFIWTQDGSPLSNSGASYQATQIGIYEVIATNNITNCTSTLVATVLASPSATATAYVNEEFADVQQIIVEVTGGFGIFLYQLDYGPFQESNTFTITRGGDYTIHVKDVSGCNTFELQVTALNFPKFFTPNNDGYNDFWNVDGLLPSQDGQIMIFDRYGKLLKQIAAIGEGWNGTLNGTPLPATDYWFVISYESVSGGSKSFRSHFSLKR